MSQSVLFIASRDSWHLTTRSITAENWICWKSNSTQIFINLYPTESPVPHRDNNPKPKHTPNMTQLRASYRGWQIRNTRFYLDSLDFNQMRSVGDANGMSNRNTLWQMWRWHLLHLETGSKEIKTRFNITSGKFFFLIKKMTKFSRQEHFLDQDFEFQYQNDPAKIIFDGK